MAFSPTYPKIKLDKSSKWIVDQIFALSYMNATIMINGNTIPIKMDKSNWMMYFQSPFDATSKHLENQIIFIFARVCRHSSDIFMRNSQEMQNMYTSTMPLAIVSFTHHY